MLESERDEVVWKDKMVVEVLRSQSIQDLFWKYC